MLKALRKRKIEVRVPTEFVYFLSSHSFPGRHYTGLTHVIAQEGPFFEG
jgi:hypothetical protein